MSSATYNVVREAVLNKRIITGVYRNYFRILCPHVIGRSAKGVEIALCYQSGGESKSGLAAEGSGENWRCILIGELTDVKVQDGQWKTAPNHSRPQTCVKQIDVEVKF